MRHKTYRLVLTICLLVMNLVCLSHVSAEKEQQPRQPTGFVIAPKRFKPHALSSRSKLGKQLFQKNNCISCHSIDSTGGCLAPPLDEIGARRNKTFILARITNNLAAIRQFEKLHGPELMPHPRVHAEDANLIASYLLTLPEPRHGMRVLPHSHNEVPATTTTEGKADTDAAQGKVLFYEHGCIACHAIGDVGGHFAPRLDAVSTRRTREFIRQRINQAEFLTESNADEYAGKGNVMPPANLNTQEIKAITDFLMSLPVQR